MQWLDMAMTYVDIAVIVIAVTIFCSLMIPSEKRYKYLVKLRLTRPELHISMTKSRSTGKVAAEQHVEFTNRGSKVPAHMELTISEPTDRWNVRITKGEWIAGNAKEVAKVGGATTTNPRWNKFRLKPPKGRTIIGHVKMKTNWAGPEADDEHFEWQITCLDVKIAEGRERVPL